MDFTTAARKRENQRPLDHHPWCSPALPFDGTEDFQETVAGAFQQTSGAEAEGGLHGMVVCDGVERTHTAHLSSFTDAVFRRGTAGASVFFIRVYARRG